MLIKQVTYYIQSLTSLIKTISITILILLIIPTKSNSQTVVYSQNFNVSLAASGWTNTNLTSPWSSGSYFGLTNNWYVNDAESGRPPNICGAANMGNFSLYMGAVGLGALGAAYLSNANTNRRISSPNINTTGYTNMTLSFNFIGNGSGTADKGYLLYSINGGTSWINATGAPTSSNPALPVGSNLNNLKSQICGSGQGLWTNITWTLPSTCENITNLRIAFAWQNSNTTPTPTDPALAVDDIMITVPSVLPIELLSFTGQNIGYENILKWETGTETNNDFFTVERSFDGINFSEIGNVNGSGNSNSILKYHLVDKTPINGINYYRLKQTDYNANYKYSSIISLNVENSNDLDLVYSFNNPETNYLELTFNCSFDCNINIELFDLLGKKLITKTANIENNYTKVFIPTSDLCQSIYLLRVFNSNKLISKKIKL